MDLKKFEDYGEFREEDCTFCGECFYNCPVLDLTIEEAKEEIRSIVKKGESEHIITNCTSCMACRHYCPEDCNPHRLILGKWQERYEKKGFPNRVKLALPYHKPNVHSVVLEKLPEKEKNLVQKWEKNWEDPPDKDTMLYAGCNFLIQPYLLDSKLFEDVSIFGSLNLCCGEPLYRMGCIDESEQIAQYLQKEFKEMGFEKLIVPCLAGYHAYTDLYESAFDIKFDFETIPVQDWLLDQLESGEHRIKNLNQTAAVHDNCWPKAGGDCFFDKVRDILNRIGIEVVEPEHTREDALCCGMASAAADYSLIDAFGSGRKRLNELKETGADMIIDYCGGCNWYFSTIQRLSIKEIPIYNLLEVVQMAIGEEAKHCSRKRGFEILKSIIRKGIPSYFKSGNYKIPDDNLPPK